MCEGFDKLVGGKGRKSWEGRSEPTGIEKVLDSMQGFRGLAASVGAYAIWS
jgi:hypothetical protein